MDAKTLEMLNDWAGRIEEGRENFYEGPPMSPEQKRKMLVWEEERIEDFVEEVAARFPGMEKEMEEQLRKRLDPPFYPRASSWDKVVQAMLDVADVADEAGCHDQADAMSGLLVKAALVRTAQYEGGQNYWLLNQRAFERAWRTKREKAGLSQSAPTTPEDFNSAQECWMKVLEEYQDALLGEDAQMLSKYAAREAPTTKRKLVTKAVTKTKDGKTFEHDVEIIEDDRGKEILYISGTPGRWYVDTLRGKDAWSQGSGIPNSIAIGLGQGWVWTNVKEVFDEVDSQGPEPATETSAIMSENMTAFHDQMDEEAKSQGVSSGEFIASKFGPKGAEVCRAIMSKVAERVMEGSAPGVAFYEAMDYFKGMEEDVLRGAISEARKVAFVLDDEVALEGMSREDKVKKLEEIIRGLSKAIPVLEQALEEIKVYKAPSHEELEERTFTMLPEGLDKPWKRRMGPRTANQG